MVSSGLRIELLEVMNLEGLHWLDIKFRYSIYLNQHWYDTDDHISIIDDTKKSASASMLHY
jgi:hypothetical protein